MKLKTRGLLFTFIIGIVLLLVAIQMPSATLDETIPRGAQASQIYFLQPMTVSISISQLQGNATLLVQPMSYDTSLAKPIVNVSVIAQDIVTMSIPNRGYYDVSFFYGNGSSPAVSYVIDESGVAPDVLDAGIILIIMSGVLFLIYSMSRQKMSKKGESRFLQVGTHVARSIFETQLAQTNSGSRSISKLLRNKTIYRPRKANSEAIHVFLLLPHFP